MKGLSVKSKRSKILAASTLACALVLALFFAAMALDSSGSSGSNNSMPPGSTQSGGGTPLVAEEPPPRAQVVCKPGGDICAEQAGVGMDFFLIGPNPDHLWVGYITDGPGGGSTFTEVGTHDPIVPVTFSLPPFTKHHAGLYMRGGAGLFESASVPGVLAALNDLLDERDGKASEYEQKFAMISALDQQIIEGISQEESGLPAIFSQKKGADAAGDVEAYIGQTTSLVASSWAQIKQLVSELKTLRSAIEQIELALESTVQTGSIESAMDKCPIIDVDVKLPASDPRDGSRDALATLNEVAISNPRPHLKVNDVSLSDVSVDLQGNVLLPVSGMVTDAIADIIEGSGGDVAEVGAFRNDVLIATFALQKAPAPTSFMRPFAKQFSFSGTLAFSASSKERNLITLRTSPNLIGNEGVDQLQFAVVLDKRADTGVAYFVTNVIGITIRGGPSLSASVVDRLVLTTGGIPPQDNAEDELTETSANSSIFTGATPAFGSVTIKVLSISLGGELVVEISSSARSVSAMNLSLEADVLSDGFFTNSATVRNTDEASLPAVGVLVVDLQNGEETGPGQFNPFYVRVVDPRGAVLPVTVGPSTFGTEERTDLSGELYATKIVVVVTQPSSTENVITSTGSLPLSYSTCMKPASQANVSFSESGSLVGTFVPLPSDAIEGMLAGEEAAADAELKAQNLTKLSPFGIDVQGGAVIKGFSRNGLFLDARGLTGKHVLLVDGRIPAEVASVAEASFTLLGQDSDVDQAKVKKNLKTFSIEDVKVAQIKFFREEGGTFVAMAWTKVLLRKDLPNIKIEVALSSEKDTAARGDAGLPVMLLAGDREEGFPIDKFKPKYQGRSRAEKLVLGGNKFSVTISSENVKKDLLGPAGKDDVNEVCAADYIATPEESSDEDTGNLLKEFASRKYKIRGYAIHRLKDKELRANSQHERLGIGDVNKEFIQSGGVEHLMIVAGVQSDLEMPKDLPPVFGLLGRQMQNNADLFMYSGHGAHQQGAIEANEDAPVGPTGTVANDAKAITNAQLADHWSDEIEVVLIAGCSVTDADVLGTADAQARNPGLIDPPEVGNVWHHPDWAVNPFNANAQWRTTPVVVFLGYRASAPSDIDQSGYLKPKGNAIALINNFLKFAKNVNVDNPRLYISRWMDANRWVHNISLGLKGDNAPKPHVGAGWRNACAVDVPGKEWHYFRNTKPDVYFYKSDHVTGARSPLPQ